MMMKSLLLLSCLLAVTLAVSLDDKWDQWKGQHEKSYEAKEELIRKQIFQKNLQKIEAHNRLHRKGKVSFSMAVNKFADLHAKEFASKFKGLRQEPRLLGRTRNTAPVFRFNNSQALPDHVDWREKGVVTPVKNQEQCGSCWAFSTTGSLEGQHAIKTGNLVSLSEQNLVDCDDIDSGCGGGLMRNAFSWIKQNGGLDTESSYPYQAEDENCRFNKATVGATDSGYVVVKNRDESALKAAVATVGPIAIGIDASSDEFQFYASGVYVDNECSSTFLDHGVLAVGYGTTSDGKDYWIVKNSWGADWGAEGYILMARNRNNQCGVSTDASYPTV